MKKTALTLLLCILIGASAGCGSDNKDADSTKFANSLTTENTTADETEAPDEFEEPNETEEPDESEEPNETEAPDESEEPNDTETPDETEESADEPQISELVLDGEIFDAALSSADNPVPLGKWASITMYNAVSGNDESCFVRINKVITEQTEVQPRISEYNEKWSSGLEIEDKYKDFFEFYIVEYEIAYPSEWSAKDGIIYSSLDLTFSAKNYDGSVGFTASDGNRYIGGYSTTVNLYKGRSDYPGPGNILKCAGAFEMTTGYDDFYLDLMFGPSGEISHGAFSIT